MKDVKDLHWITAHILMKNHDISVFHKLQLDPESVPETRNRILHFRAWMERNILLRHDCKHRHFSLHDFSTWPERPIYFRNESKCLGLKYWAEYPDDAYARPKPPHRMRFIAFIPHSVPSYTEEWVDLSRRISIPWLHVLFVSTDQCSWLQVITCSVKGRHL